MQKGEKSIIKKRLRSSYLTSVISISLVLFMLGIIGFLFLNAKKLSDYVKETIGFTVFLSDDTKEAAIFQLQKLLDNKVYVKETRYITAEKAAEEFQKEIGEDFVEFLGFNPLVPSIDVKLHSAYANTDSIENIEKDLQEYSQIKEVYYQKSLINLINENVKKISFFIFIITVILFTIALALINNTVRLSIYSKRFIIRTMQLVGATGSFIRRPFLFRSFIYGSLASIIAMIMLTAMIYLADREFNNILGLYDFEIIALLYLMVLVCGIFINWISTYFAVGKYLNIKTDNLYS